MINNVVPDNSEIVVQGKDMFGAPFSEKAHLLSLDHGEFSFSLFRPVSEQQSIRVNFQPGGKASDYWVDVLIVDVKNRLDGMQTVEVKVLSGSHPLAAFTQHEQPARS